MGKYIYLVDAGPYMLRPYISRREVQIESLPIVIMLYFHSGPWYKPNFSQVFFSKMT